MALSDERRSSEKIISIFDLLTAIFTGRSKYQELFAATDTIPIITEILKQNNNIEGSTRDQPVNQSLFFKYKYYSLKN